VIKLSDFLELKKLKLPFAECKIHCATGDVNPPLDAFYDGRFKEWQEYQTQKNFQRPYVLSLIHLEGSHWLYAGIYKVNGEPRLGTEDGREIYYYETTFLEGQEDHIGKIIVHFEKGFRASYLLAEKHMDQISIIKILEERKTIGEFPGFNKVKISHQELERIIRMREKSWAGALTNIKGIYLITDKSNGKHYVGSAIGEEGIWSRWSSYAFNGHGGNKELVALLKDSPEQFKNYQYSILEIADSHTSDQEILERESFWKDILGSRAFGYNAN